MRFSRRQEIASSENVTAWRLDDCRWPALTVLFWMSFVGLLQTGLEISRSLVVSISRVVFHSFVYYVPPPFMWEHYGFMAVVSLFVCPSVSPVPVHNPRTEKLRKLKLGRKEANITGHPWPRLESRKVRHLSRDFGGAQRCVYKDVNVMSNGRSVTMNTKLKALDGCHYRQVTTYYLFIYLLTKRNIQMYCHVQREQDNKAQITGTNSCPLSLDHTATDTNTMQCI